jgi:hypothetical protein
MVMTPAPTTPDSRSRDSWKWLRRAFSAVSLVAAITFLLTTEPLSAAKLAAAERGHDQDGLGLIGYENSNARWAGGSTTVHLSSADRNGRTDIDVILKRPFWLFGWQVEGYAERPAGK